MEAYTKIFASCQLNSCIWMGGSRRGHGSGHYLESWKWLRFLRNSGMDPMEKQLDLGSNCVSKEVYMTLSEIG